MCPAGCIPYPVTVKRHSGAGIGAFTVLPASYFSDGSFGSWGSTGYEAYCPYRPSYGSDKCQEGSCNDGTPISHYYNLQPSCFSISGLPYGSAEPATVSPEDQAAIQREVRASQSFERMHLIRCSQIWTHGPVTANLQIFSDNNNGFHVLENYMITPVGVYSEEYLDSEQTSLAGWQ